MLSGSRLAWFEGDSAPGSTSKPTGSLGLRGAIITPSGPPAKLGVPAATIVIVAADGKSAMNIGVASISAAASWEQALRAASGDASARAAFLAARAAAAPPGQSVTGSFSEVTEASTPVSMSRPTADGFSVSSGERDAAPARLHDSSAAAAAVATTAALQARITELEAQNAAEAARRIEVERAAAAEAARAAQLLSEREEARRREAELAAALHHRSAAAAASLAKVDGGPADDSQASFEPAAARSQPAVQAAVPPTVRPREADAPAGDSSPEALAHPRSDQPPPFIGPPRTGSAAPAPSVRETLAAGQSSGSAADATASAANLLIDAAAPPMPDPPTAGSSNGSTANFLVDAAAPPPVSQRLAGGGPPPKPRAVVEPPAADATGVDESVSTPPPAVALEPEWGPWACEPNGEERVAMKKRM